MGKAPRARPTRLGEKIVEIRRKLGLSQNGLIKHLGMDEKLFQGDVSAWELGNRDPDLPTLLLLARAAGVYADVLIDDALDLPKKLPANQRGSEVDGKRFSKRNSKGNTKSKHTVTK